VKEQEKATPEPEKKESNVSNKAGDDGATKPQSTRKVNFF
jgi:hypothetical protein